MKLGPMLNSLKQYQDVDENFVSRFPPKLRHRSTSADLRETKLTLNFNANGQTYLITKDFSHKLFELDSLRLGSLSMQTKNNQLKILSRLLNIRRYTYYFAYPGLYRKEVHLVPSRHWNRRSSETQSRLVSVSV